MQIIEPDWAWSGPLTKRSGTEYLILHHAAGNGSVEAIHRMHLARGWVGIGYHYYVRKDGSIYRGRPEDSVGGHTVGYNYRSIGVCFEGNFENETMSAVQLNAGRWLIADILSRYPSLKVVGHRELDATACPGKNFPLAELIEKEAEAMDVSTFINSLTDEQAYFILEKAQRHAAKLPLPDWAKEEYTAAVSAGITDGEQPMRLVPRCQAAIMALRSK